LDLPTPEDGRLSDLGDLGDQLQLEMITHPSNNRAAHSWDWSGTHNQLIDALTATLRHGSWVTVISDLYMLLQLLMN